MRFNKDKMARRKFLAMLGGAAVLTFSSKADSQNPGKPGTSEMLVYVGTYTSGKSKSEGIYIYKLNMETGALSPYKTVKSVVEPSFLVVDDRKRCLYAVNETVEY